VNVNEAEVSDLLLAPKVDMTIGEVNRSQLSVGDSDLTLVDAGSISGTNHYFDNGSDKVHFDSISGSNVYADGYANWGNRSDTGGSAQSISLNTQDSAQGDIIEVDSISGSNVYMSNPVAQDNGNNIFVLSGSSSEYSVTDNGGGHYIVSGEGVAPSNIYNADAIVFKGDGHIVGDQSLGATVLGETVSSYNYPMTISTDFETSTVLNALPDGVSLLDSDANSISADSNGNYEIALDNNGEAHLNIVSTQALSNTELNNITVEVTATNPNTNNRATTIAHSDLDESNDTLNDTVDVDSINPVVQTGDGNDIINVDAQDLAHSLDIDGGEGYDTLLVSGDTNIDMGALGDNVKNIEAINLDTGTQNITNLTLSDVIDITDEDNVLRIDGDETDSVSLTTAIDGSGEWKLGDVVTDAQTGNTYQEVTSVDDTVKLEINTEIQIDHY
jgi:hypothetical protein